MKKTFLIISVAAVLFCLSACSKETKHQTVIDNPVGECKQSVFANAGSNMAVGDTGYYTLEGFGKHKYITYISKDSAKSTYLCGKPECSHVDELGRYGLETCDAHIGQAMPQSIKYHNGYIYVLRYDERTYDVTLVRISADGSVHEDVMAVGQAPDCASYYQYVFADDGTVFMVYNAPDYTGEMRTISLDRLDLDKREKTSVYTYSEMGAAINYLKVLNNYVFFKQSRKSDKISSYTLMHYDMGSNIVNKVLDGNVISYTIANDGKIFYYISTDALYSLDLNTMQSTKIRQCDEDTMYVMLAYDGKYLYLDNLLNRSYYKEDSEHKIFVCDTDGTDINIIPCGGLYIELSDSNYIFIQDFLEAGEQCWSYIKKENIENSVKWNNIKKE